MHGRQGGPPARGRRGGFVETVILFRWAGMGRAMSLIIGLLAGAFGGLLGIGGGVVMIPMMVGLLKVGQHRAHGTSLTALVFIGAGGAATYMLRGSVDLYASALLAATAVITAHIGARYANALLEWQLRRSFGAFLLFASCLMFLKPYLPHSMLVSGGWARALVLMSTGAATGFLSGMMGVGGGAVMVPVMVLFLGLDQYTAQGSSLLTMVPTGISGAWTHMRLGNVETRLLAGLVAGVLVGTYLGGSAAHLLPEGDLRTVFGLVLAWMGLRYIIKRKHVDG